jgi:Flp pilus assembly protein TadD
LADVSFVTADAAGAPAVGSAPAAAAGVDTSPTAGSGTGASPSADPFGGTGAAPRTGPLGVGALPVAPAIQPQRRRWLLSGIALLLIAAIAIAWIRFSPPTKIHSLVVLPFQNLSSDATQEFFADGMTDELITHLGPISALRVISRTSAMSYKATTKPLTDIARELNVEALVLVTGRTNDGLYELRTAYSQDPLSLIISADLADALCIAHLLDESVRQSLRTLEFDPNFALRHYQLGQAYEQQKLHSQAVAEFQKAIAIGGHTDAFDANLAYSLASSGRKQEAGNILADMLARNEENASAQSNIALIYAGLGKRDEAIAWLDRAYESRFNPSTLLRPTFDSLRSDARFQDLRQRIGLPQQ